MLKSMRSDYLLSVVANDVPAANKLLDALIGGFASGVDLVAVLVAMGLFSWPLMLVVFASLPPVMVYNRAKGLQVSVKAAELNDATKVGMGATGSDWSTSVNHNTLV